MPRRVCRLRR